MPSPGLIKVRHRGNGRGNGRGDGGGGRELCVLQTLGYREVKPIEAICQARCCFLAAMHVFEF
jgi:hypothetical protein